MAKISVADRHRIIIYYQDGLSQREIARKCKFSRTAIQNIIKKFNETGSVEDKKRCGRPKKLGERQERFLRLQSLRNRAKTSTELAQDLQEATGVSVDSSTVRRSLLKSGLRGCVAIKKSLFRKGNKQKRLQYAREHSNWKIEDWKTVLWTDESKFELFGGKRRQFVRRRKGEAYQEACLKPTVKHGGGSVMVWGCISANGVGDLIRINGKLTATQYLEILQQHAVPSGQRLIGNKFLFQHDNDPKHTARIVKNYLQELEDVEILRVMNWPPQSPDLNIIEHVWDYLDRARRKSQPKNADELFEVLQTEWRKIPMEIINNLYESCTRRIDAVIKAKGGHTKY
ncbi:Transposable element Tcb1 transposase [Anthophora quadrimaculata]